MLLFLHFSSSSQVLLTCRRVRTMASYHLPLWNMLRKERVTGAFLSPRLTFPFISLPSPSPFPTLTPTLSRPHSPSFSRFESQRRGAGAGGMERFERGGRRKKLRKGDGYMEKGGSMRD